MKPALVALAAALALSACETATPYQPASVHNPDASGGYSERQIEGDRWLVTFSGNSLTSRQTVDRYLLFRAAQLTLDKGYDWFASVDRHTDKQTSYYSDPDPYFAGWGPYWGGFYRGGARFGGWGAFGGGWGGPWGGPWGDPYFEGPFDTEQVTRFRASAEIVMGHGPKPADNTHAYDARDVVAHLQGEIAYPKPH